MRRPILLALALALVPALPALADEGPAAAGRAARRTPIVEAVEKAAPAVVSIGTTKIVKVRYWDFLPARTQEQHALGSGVIVHPSGYVVTNAHVINRADKIVVKLTGTRESEPEIPAELIAVDLSHDLALLRLEKPGPYPFVEFGRSDDLMIGETVLAIGNPFGIGRTVSSGIISALDRSLDVRDAKFKGFIQTDAAVNHGNSGGPLLNILGDWIGVNSAIYSLGGGADGISFAIPVDTVRAFVVDSLRTARFGGSWLGVEFATKGGGLVVERVHESSPGARAGVETGARLATYTDPLRLCFDLVDASRKGSFTFDVLDRGGKARAVTVAFEAPPSLEDLAWRRLGLKVAAVDDDLASRTVYRAGSGLVILEVKDGGPAGRIDLRRGDLITSIGGSRVTTDEELLSVVLATARGQVEDVELARPVRQGFGGVDVQTRRGRITVE
jgi:serine protease Do